VRIQENAISPQTLKIDIQELSDSTVLVSGYILVLMVSPPCYIVECGIEHL
jgi:hypothetical protein